MEYYGLSKPKVLAKGNILDLALEEYSILYKTFLDYEARPTLQGAKIFVKNDIIQGMHERYLHSISLADKKYYKAILPCTNEEASINCITKCKLENSTFIFQRLKRTECLYRLSRIQWIPEVIKYANENNEFIKIWRNEQKDETNEKWVWKRKVRYKNGLADFIIIFNELYDKTNKNKLNYLDFRTAYPIFLPQEGVDLDKEYVKCTKK
ncbi:hypothetical protein [Desnuesiella massiliensis]|uniref:hypothetical protein n=1 Tax=Desnuesiella massiliensis TaxID=1650662 RepID=UPI0006E17CB6|nr:hypothetical protein [Desnuesiella massiliensis]